MLIDLLSSIDGKELHNTVKNRQGVGWWGVEGGHFPSKKRL